MIKESHPDAIVTAYVRELADELAQQLADADAVHARVHATRAHAPTFPEVRFCKGCVLPIVDRATTRFFASQLGLPSSAARAALRCEGASTLETIYTPGEGQSGFSGITWGTNYQATTKAGRPGNYRPCPDFGIIHGGPPPLLVLGEVKYARNNTKRDALLRSIRHDMTYYMGLPRQPKLGWPYEYGIGIAFGVAPGSMPVVEVLWNDWAERRFVLLLLHSTDA